MKTRYPLPTWASVHAAQANTIIADPDLFYPALLKEIADSGVPENYPPLDVERPGRYWVEVAYQFAKLDLQLAVGRFGFNILIQGSDGRKQRWGLKGFKSICKKLKAEDLQARHRHLSPSKIDPDEYRATYGCEARDHYERVRGFIPR